MLLTLYLYSNFEYKLFLSYFLSVSYLYYKNYLAIGVFSRTIFLLFMTVNVSFKGKLLYIQGETQKFLDNCYKTQITSYMDTIYFYSSKYIPP